MKHTIYVGNKKEQCPLEHKTIRESKTLIVALVTFIFGVLMMYSANVLMREYPAIEYEIVAGMPWAVTSISGFLLIAFAAFMFCKYVGEGRCSICPRGK